MFVGKKRPTAATTRLGEILVEAGVIDHELVNQSLSIAKNSKLPIGRVLSMYGFANDRVIESAVEAQRGLRDGRFNRQQASQLVRVAYTSHVTIDQAQSLIGLSMADSSSFGEVGKMLLAAGIVDTVILQQAEIELKHTNNCLGQWLIDKQHVTPQLLINAFHLTLLCRDEALPKLDAVSTLQKIHAEKITLGEAASALSLGQLPEQKDIHLSAFLIIGHLVPQKQVIEALETCIERKTFVGHILVEQMILNPITLDAAVHLQEMFEHELITLEEGCEIFSFVKDLNMPLDELLVEFEKMTGVAKFIFSCGFVSQSDCEAHSLSQDESDIMMGIHLLRSGLIEDKVVRCAAQIVSNIEREVLTEQEAIGVFNYCIQMAVEPEEAIQKLDLQSVCKARTQTGESGTGDGPETAAEMDSNSGNSDAQVSDLVDFDSQESDKNSQESATESQESSRESQNSGSELCNSDPPNSDLRNSDSSSVDMPAEATTDETAAEEGS
jgi:hypothetical protein